MAQEGSKKLTLSRTKTKVKTETEQLSVSNGEDECYEEAVVEEGVDAPKYKVSKSAFAPFLVWVIVTIVFVIIGIIWALWVRDSQVWKNWGLNPVFASLCWILLFIVVSFLLLLLAAWGKTGLAWVVLIIAIFLPILFWVAAVYSPTEVVIAKTTVSRNEQGTEIKKTVVRETDVDVISRSKFA